ncbi:MAG: hypothetical protein CL458_01755 [Acidimicrobiaceae bacterium]|nr:hypothetical protein [Acidimicrobiaceae bacterium]|tara:strand:+ start:3877 stop:5658 length:1782 start_codon:yes stop_codon:yes gene_type:complete
MKVFLGNPETKAPQAQSATSPKGVSFLSQPLGRIGYRSRRVGSLIFFSSGLLLLIATRLFWVQVVDREEHLAEIYRRKAEISIQGSTGRILDRDGSFMAVTDVRPTIGANPRLIASPWAAARALAPDLSMSVDALYGLLSKDRAYVYLKRQVTPEVEEAIRSLELPGIEIRQETARLYPNGQEFARNFIGQVNIDEEPLNGIEAQYAHTLSGKAGVRQDYVANTAGRSMRLPGGDLNYQAPEPGSDLVTTIHAPTQYLAEGILKQAVEESGAKWGTAVVLDAESAEVLALVDIDRGEESELVKVAATSGAYGKTFEPGSVSKTFTIAAAIELGEVSSGEIFKIPSSYQYADKKYSDPYSGQELAVAEVLAKSSNVGTIQIAERLGADQMYHYLRAFGFGKYSSGDDVTPSLPHESRGKLKLPQDWEGTDLANISFGQGLSVTAIQVAAAYNVIANDGVYVAPSLVRGTLTPTGAYRPLSKSSGQKVLSEATTEEMREMLKGVVVHGTGKRAAVDGYAVAGKTGTAQKPMTDRRGYGDEYTSIFAGFVPVAEPKITIVVVLDEPEEHSAGRAVAPVFSAIAAEVLTAIGVPEGE